jgi:hypothetical protein
MEENVCPMVFFIHDSPSPCLIALFLGPLGLLRTPWGSLQHPGDLCETLRLPVTPWAPWYTLGLPGKPYSARNLKRTAAAAAVLLLKEPAFCCERHLAADTELTTTTANNCPARSAISGFS